MLPSHVSSFLCVFLYRFYILVYLASVCYIGFPFKHSHSQGKRGITFVMLPSTALPCSAHYYRLYIFSEEERHNETRNHILHSLLQYPLLLSCFCCSLRSCVYIWRRACVIMNPESVYYISFPFNILSQSNEKRRNAFVSCYPSTPFLVLHFMLPFEVAYKHLGKRMDDNETRNCIIS